MANVIKQQNIIDTAKRSLLKFVFVSDGSADANTVLLDASILAYSLNANSQIKSGGTDRKSNYRTTIKRIAGTSQSNNGISTLQWHGTAAQTNVAIVTFGKSQRFDYDFQSMGDGATISNPNNVANTTGNVMITTAGYASGETFTLFVDLRKNSADYEAGQIADPVAFNLGPALGPQ